MTRRGLSVDLSATFTADGADSFAVNADFTVECGETLVVLGPSGSGKTLLLETIAGFHPHEGTVELGDVTVSDVPPERRDFGFVFQDYMLFPHLTVRENVSFGERYHDESRDPDELLSVLGVGDLADRYPGTLSGGEQQRVALARSLAVRPELLLLDEPLSSLDVPTRQSLRDDLTDVLADVTAVYVTHNRTTARAIADRIVVMRSGEIVQVGPPAAVFERPATPAVANFTGANCIELAAAPSIRTAVGAGDTRADASRTDERGTHVTFRPEAIELEGATGDFRATVERVVREDATCRVTLSVDDVTIEAFAEQPPRVGEDVWISIPDDRIHFC